MRALGVLGAVAALLAAYLLFFDHDPRDAGQRSGNPLVSSFDPAGVSRVFIARAEKPPLSLVRMPDGQGWRVQPENSAADNSAVRDFLSALVQAESDRTAEISAAAAGLSPPAVTVSVDGPGAAVQLRLGKTDAGGGGVFTQAGPGQPIHVGPRRLLELAERPPEAWRAPASPVEPAADGKLLAVPPAQVRRIELVDGARHLILARAEAGARWRLEAPPPAADPDAGLVSAWLDQLASAAKPAPAQTGRRLIVNGAGGVVVGPNDPAFSLLDPDPLRFRSREVLDFAHFDARELRRTSAAGTLDARSTDGESWTSTPPADAAVVGRIVGALGNLRAAGWLARAPQGRPDLVLEISVQAPGDPVAVRHTLQLWPDCVGEMENAGTFRIAQDLCADLRHDPASAEKR